MQARIKLVRSGVYEAYDTLHSFCQECRTEEKRPFHQLHKLKLSLSKMAETIEKSIISLWEILVPPKRRNSKRSYGDTVLPHTDELLPPNGSFDEASNAVTVSRPDPSKNTPNTTSETSQKNTHRSEDFFYREKNTLNFDPPEKDQELIKKVKFQNSQKLNQPDEDREVGSQVKDPLMKTNIPSAENDSLNQTLKANPVENNTINAWVVSENYSEKNTTEGIEVEDNTITHCVVIMGENVEDNSWVEDLEAIIRNGDPLPRSELFKLAEYRLGKYVSLYRKSGRILDANPNDLKPEFLKFVQWYSFNGDPNLAFVIQCVKKYERNPEQWDLLLSWLQAFQEVQANPESLETILSQKLASQGKNPNKRDLDTMNHINIQKVLSEPDKEWWQF